MPGRGRGRWRAAYRSRAAVGCPGSPGAVARRRRGRRRQIAPSRLVDQQQRDVGQRVAERGHLPVDDRADPVVGVDQDVVEPVVAVHDARRRGSSAGTLPVSEPVQLVGVGGARGSASPRAACPSGAPAARGSPRAGRSRRARPPPGRRRAARRARRPAGRRSRAVRSAPSGVELGRGAVRRAVDPLHHVERRAEHVGRRRRARRSAGPARRCPASADIAVYSRPMSWAVACTWPSGGRRTIHHDGAVGDLVGEVGLAAGDQRAAVRSPAISPGRCASYQRRKAARSRPGDVGRIRAHPIPCTRRPWPAAGASRPASASVSAARAA